MKKLVSLVLIISMVFNLGAFAYADVNNSDNSGEIETIVDSKLPDDIELPTLTESGQIGVNSYPGPINDTIRINGPYYRTYNNTADKIIISALVSLLSSGLTSAVEKIIGKKIPKAASALFGAIFGYQFDIKDKTYVGTWTCASYSNYYDEYIYYATLVHYKNSDYTKPIKIQYYEVGRSATLER